MKAFQYENVEIQDEVRAIDKQIQICENIKNITHLTERYEDHAIDLRKGTTILIVEKHITSVTDKYHDLSYYVSTI